jgi:quercetin dioxygenase-like cupin family protein
MTELKSEGKALERLDILTWAESASRPGYTELRVDSSEQPVDMHGAPDATGRGLVSNGTMGLDVIRLPAGAGFRPHTHPGHHILIVVAGTGTITYDGRVYETEAGQTYLVEGGVPHAVGAITDHVILAVGSPHRPVDADDRMEAVAYEEVIAPDGDLTCLICDRTAVAPSRLHDVDCSHCPCADCVGGDE